jgi:hypothetical protein
MFHKKNNCPEYYFLETERKKIVTPKYSANVLNADCQTQGRLKLMIELYVSEKSVIPNAL